MDQMFPPNGFAMRAPILVWWAVLELLGLIAFPFTFLMLGNLPDKGFVVAKTIGLVLTVYLVWIAVSLLTRYISVASMVSAVVLLAGVIVTDQPWPVIAFALFGAAVVIWRHRSNIARLRAGTENRLNLRGARP